MKQILILIINVFIVDAKQKYNKIKNVKDYRNKFNVKKAFASCIQPGEKGQTQNDTK